jgi:tetratricopeptide (TPR) repeat protein
MSSVLLQLRNVVVRVAVVAVLALWHLASSAAYADEEHARNVLVGMFARQDFAELDRALSKLDEEYWQGKVTPAQWEGRLYAIPDWNALNLLPSFDKWVSVSQRPYARLTRAMYLHMQAYEARGSRYGKDTSAAQFAEFKRLSAAAHDDLLQVVRRTPRCSICYAFLVTTSLSLGQSDASRKQFVEDALKADPRGARVHFEYLHSLLPQWRGSFAVMEAYIGEVRRRGLAADVVQRLESRYCFHRADDAEQRGDSRAAYQWLLKGAHDHADDLLMKNLAVTHMKQGRVKQAIDVLERNLRINNEWDVFTLGVLADAYSIDGRADLARQAAARRDESNRRYVAHE